MINIANYFIFSSDLRTNSLSTMDFTKKCPEFTPEGFQQLFEMCIVLQNKLDQKKEVAEIVQPKVVKKTERCCALVWNGGNGARCSKKQVIGQFCTAHDKAISSGTHKHGTLDNPCDRFSGKKFGDDIAVVKKSKKKEHTEVLPILSEDQISKCLQELLDLCKTSRDVSQITSSKVMETLKITKVDKDSKTMLENITRKMCEEKTAAFLDENIDTDEDCGEECECEEINIDGVNYLVEPGKNNVYTDDDENKYVGRYLNGQLDTSLPEI